MKMNRLFLGALFALVLLLPSAIAAGPVTMLGSVKIEAADASDLTGKLVGVAVIANPGLEKTISQQIPSFTLPVFVDGDRADGGTANPRPFLNRRLDTTLLLTNTHTGALNIIVRLRDANGTLLNSTPYSLAQDATIVVAVSGIVP
jgi:hypothetical protein